MGEFPSARKRHFRSGPTSDKAPSEIPAKIAKIVRDPSPANRRAYLAQLYRRGEIGTEDMQRHVVEQDIMNFVTGDSLPT